MPVGAATFCVIGMVMVLTAAVWAWRAQAFREGALRATGTVIGIRTDRSENQKRRVTVTYSPIVRFRDGNGAEVEFTGLGSTPASYQVGQEVPVLYPATAPARAKIDSRQEFAAGPLVVGGFGLLFLGTAALLWRLGM